MRTLLSLFILSLVLSWTSQGWAQKIAVARMLGDDRIANRLNAELSALGFEIEMVELTASNELYSLRQIATERAAMAGLRASPSRTSIEMWVADPRTGTTAVEEVVTVDSGRNDELLALRAVEVLRARLLKLGVRSARVPELEAATAPARVAPSELPVSVQRPTRLLLWMDLGTSYTFNLGALSNHESTHIGVTLSPHAMWSLSALTIIPLRKAELSHPAGTATANHTLLAVAGDAHLHEQWVRASLGAGAALAVLDVEGQARFPFEGQRQRLVTALPFVRAGAAAKLADRILLRAGFIAGMSTPKPVIRVNQRDVADWGRPLLIGTLSLELGLLTEPE